MGKFKVKFEDLAKDEFKTLMAAGGGNQLFSCWEIGRIRNGCTRNI